MTQRHSYTGGVTPMNIASRLVSERERLVGMTDDERAWRKQWLKDQVLSPNEPRYVPEYWRARTNIFRRIYRWPLDTLFKPLTPIMGQEVTTLARLCTGKTLHIVALGYLAYYYMKYNRHDWQRKGGWRMYMKKPTVLPGEPEYPYLSKKTKPSDYANFGFTSSPI